LSPAGSLGAGLFLLASALIALMRWQMLLEVIIRNLWVLILPLLILSSTFWSDYPGSSLRGGFQFFVTVTAGVIAGTFVRPSILTSAAFSAFLSTVAICLILGLKDYLHGNPQTIHLLLGSKNQLAELGAYLLITSLSIALVPYWPSLLRAVAGASIIIAFFIVIVAQSVGSSLFLIPAVFTMLALRTLAFLPASARAAIFVIAVPAMLTVGLAGVSLLKNEGQVLDSIGKDTTLTGRAELWAEAQAYFSERPVLGVGYQAFWQVENPRAVRLWLLNGVPAGSGFNFHNLYFNTAVELGVTGLAVLILLQLSIMARLLLTFIGPINPRQLFGAGISVYLLGISLAEVIQTYQFMAGTMLYYVSWCYLSPQWRHKRA
jgi:exopolysaccharide production protein ExoQ